MGVIKIPGENPVSVKSIAVVGGHLDGYKPVAALP